MTQCPVSLSRMFLSPGNMHNENKARRITTHVTRTPSIYVYNILRENSDEWIFGVHPPPSWFYSKWIIKWNTQPRVVRSTFDMVHWFFSAFFFLDINHKNTNYFPSIIDHIRRNWIIAGTRHQGILKRIVGTRGVLSVADRLPLS